ncbi:hemerythrin domain-containing protein [Clostridium magnum]|uniref:Hemerythrin HHE cation binding domain protein n=1 Tax=Clostridium magnum DSM 2767 TaxID=1121326 RepID=A0A161XFZ6_9CLOT|nr:hemerythrin domain-containing protein [Clostridium magnum]KZL93486.1 hemerythrin HHE cation binding domain protein [Clostridium magnum DSM 2767]SHI27430.1 Hemerythrin-like domain-containing protein [Clostridium magnum DSM 2767]
MDAVELMKEEHEYIKRGLNVIRKMSISILESGEIDYEDFKSIIEFIRNYADKHHHNKEESILFKKMEEQIGGMVKAPLSGMFIEHDLGRLFISNLELALQRVKKGDRDSRVDVIANAIGYTDLLTRHIDKEDKAIYSFAKRALSVESLEDVNNACRAVEESAAETNIQDTYMKILKRLEEKWQ